MKNLVVLGPPGSGKDTQVGELANYLDFELISGGDVSRKLAEKKYEYRKIVNTGGLLDDDLVLAEVDTIIGGIDKSKGIVFDGFPRTLHQAESLSEILLHHDRSLDKAIYIALEEEEIVKRLSRRKVCALCGKNLFPSIGKCPKCGGRPVSRPDDEPAVIIKRVQTFLENTLPLVNYYRNKGILIEIDGNQSIIQVAKDIKEKLSDDSRR